LLLIKQKKIDIFSYSTDTSVMTETSVETKLPGAVERFVLQWGDMGGQWGVNRSVAQIHALLYLSERPITAEEIAETLGMARSNVSNSLKELTGWKLIRRVPVFGDRRDHFEAETDLWEMVTRIAQGRKEREIDPAAAALRACRAEAERDARVSRVAKKRLAEMEEFVRALDRWYDQMLAVPAPTIMALIRMGSKVASLVGWGRGKSREGPKA
jgi:DNA-binding transcriptional regulator GbsR (MarR family)